jgi:hypothetical protein
MTDLERRAETYRIGRLFRRGFLQRVLLIGSSVPVALALPEAIGVSADAAAMSEALPATNALKPDARELLRCSFCNKHKNDTRSLIAGPACFICDECVQVCNDIIADDAEFHSRSRE